MPYITFSRKLPHGRATSSASKYLSGLFENSLVARRGVKSVKKIIAEAHSLGFAKIIIISESKDDKRLRFSIIDSNTRTKRFEWLGTYAFEGKSKKFTLKNDEGNEATKEFTNKACE